MMVAVHATGDFPDLRFLGAEWDGVKVYAMAKRQEFSSLLFRDPEAIGLLHCHLPDMAAQFVRGMREGNIQSNLLVLLRERGTEEYRVRARVQALIAGADDVQPDVIDPREVVARLRALQQRTRAPEDLIAIPPDGQFDPTNQTVVGESVTVHLTGKESALLELLASRPGVLMSKSLCMQALYGGRDEAGEKIIDVYLCKLRRKLVPICGDLSPIQTVWGQGYRFMADEVAV